MTLTSLPVLARSFGLDLNDEDVSAELIAGAEIWRFHCRRLWGDDVRLVSDEELKVEYLMTVHRLLRFELYAQSNNVTSLEDVDEGLHEFMVSCRKYNPLGIGLEYVQAMMIRMQNYYRTTKGAK